MDRAVSFLGHPHVLTNRVTHGKKIGSSSLGFPTVNLRIPPHVIVPAFGVYATRVVVDGKSHMAATNVGVRPTVEDNDGRVTVEGFILDLTATSTARSCAWSFTTACGASRSSPPSRPSPTRSAATPSRPGTTLPPWRSNPRQVSIPQGKDRSSMRSHLEHKRYDRMYLFFWLYTAALVVASLVLEPPQDLLEA